MALSILPVGWAMMHRRMSLLCRICTAVRPSLLARHHLRGTEKPWSAPVIGANHRLIVLEGESTPYISYCRHRLQSNEMSYQTALVSAVLLTDAWRIDGILSDVMVQTTIHTALTS
jgi:hypothetical protein